MPEGRDRRVTPVDVAAIFARRRASIFNDDSDPVIFEATPGPGQTRVGLGTPRNRIGRGGSENTPPLGRGGSFRRGRGRGSRRRSVLPSWYPRTPLGDVTAVVRAIERRRARFGGNESQQTANSFPAFQILLDDPSLSASGAHLEHGASVPSPKQGSVKLQTPAGSKVPKILLDFTNTSEEGSELTPQKKLLNSIDTVEKAVREELQKLKRTPSAKKAEREKRVRTLMSMR